MRFRSAETNASPVEVWYAPWSRPTLMPREASWCRDPTRALSAPLRGRTRGVGLPRETGESQAHVSPMTTTGRSRGADGSNADVEAPVGGNPRHNRSPFAVVSRRWRQRPRGGSSTLRSGRSPSGREVVVNCPNGRCSPRKVGEEGDRVRPTTNPLRASHPSPRRGCSHAPSGRREPGHPHR